MNKEAVKQSIEAARTALGIELGSTRIKACLIDEKHVPVAAGEFTWENRLENGIWTYHMDDDIIRGIQSCYADLAANVEKEYGVKLTKVGAIGVSAMMHGYLPFDSEWKQLAEFRTWRNTITGEAAEKLTELFHFNVPQRWSIAHLYQAVLKKEEHLPRLAHLTTLAGYIHYRLTGENVMGVGEASGMFPIDSAALDYDAAMADKFDALIAGSYSWKLREVLPKVLTAGADAGCLSEEGAKFLDPTGTLQAGIVCVPPEGDAGTGMVATNAVRGKTGNVSAGTSDFAMVVLEKPIGVHEELDMVTTPAGLPVAMVHCNNCTSDINAWAGLFKDFAKAAGMEISTNDLYTTLFKSALEGEKDAGGLIPFNYVSGEGVTKLDSGRPLFIRTQEARLSLANFMRANLMSAMATLAIGMEILTREEKVEITSLTGHGGYFKTPGVGQLILSAACGTSVSVMESAGEGGPYGMAILAAYRIEKEDGETLEDYLDRKVFSDAKIETLKAEDADIEGFAKFLGGYKKALAVERAAVENVG
ncbi:MAG: ATPase [Lachnospiraceae bacterium]|nr:ATPase [Lachnospiraceae bacterium]